MFLSLKNTTKMLFYQLFMCFGWVDQSLIYVQNNKTQMINCRMHMKLREVTATPKTMEKLNRWKRDIQNLTAGNYRPYLTVRAVNQIGRRHWIYCNVQRRQAHLLSDGEKRMYKKLIYTPGTLRVFEQYALNLDESLDIAVAANLIHPRNWETCEAYVMRTDFLVQSRDPENPSRIITTAYSFKYASQIFVVDEEGNILETDTDEPNSQPKPVRKNARSWQKFEIEKRYWESRNVNYRIVTDLDATKEEVWNIEFCEPAARLNFPADIVQSFVVSFCRLWQKQQGSVKQAKWRDRLKKYWVDELPEELINAFFVGRVSKSYPTNLIYQLGAQFHPLKHLLVIQHLFGSLSAFLNCYSNPHELELRPHYVACEAIERVSPEKTDLLIKQLRNGMSLHKPLRGPMLVWDMQNQ
tara:strand:- start:1845 stop:3077 length:1233 start_codon:yes stop_codon:yes gene_type:complete